MSFKTCRKKSLTRPIFPTFFLTGINYIPSFCSLLIRSHYHVFPHSDQPTKSSFQTSQEWMKRSKVTVQVPCAEQSIFWRAPLNFQLSATLRGSSSQGWLFSRTVPLPCKNCHQGLDLPEIMEVGKIRVALFPSLPQGKSSHFSCPFLCHSHAQLFEALPLCYRQGSLCSEASKSWQIRVLQ